MFESWQDNNSPSNMFDNDRGTKYVSESQGSESVDSENRKIEIIFNERIFLSKLVLMKSKYHRSGFDFRICYID